MSSAPDPLSGPNVRRIAVTPALAPVYDAYGRQYQAPRPVTPERSSARVMYRDIPTVTTSTEWTVDAVRSALAGHVSGSFAGSAQLCDAMVGDDRIHSALGSRVGALFGLPSVYECEDTEVREAWRAAWERGATPQVQADAERWVHLMGFALVEILWDTEAPVWQPYLKVWHPQFSRFDPMTRTYRVVTQDGEVECTPGGGRWLVITPHGHDRGFLFGAVRALALPWLLRNFAYRDWARYSERHGMPMIKAEVPEMASSDDKDLFVSGLRTLGQESVVRLPVNLDGSNFDVSLLEATANTWQGFLSLINKCDTAITLTLQWQNLTTEIKEGSEAAARVHADVKQTAIEFDDRTLSEAVGTQVARVFVEWNFGACRPVPVTRHDTSVTEDHEAAAKVLENLSRSVAALTSAGVQVDARALAGAYGVRLPVLPEASKKPPILDYHIQAGVLTRDEIRERLGEAPMGGVEGGELVGGDVVDKEPT